MSSSSVEQCASDAAAVLSPKRLLDLCESPSALGVGLSQGYGD